MYFRWFFWLLYFKIPRVWYHVVRLFVVASKKQWKSATFVCAAACATIKASTPVAPFFFNSTLLSYFQSIIFIDRCLPALEQPIYVLCLFYLSNKNTYRFYLLFSLYCNNAATIQKDSICASNSAGSKIALLLLHVCCVLLRLYDYIYIWITRIFKRRGLSLYVLLALYSSNFCTQILGNRLHGRALLLCSNTCIEFCRCTSSLQIDTWVLFYFSPNWILEGACSLCPSAKIWNNICTGNKCTSTYKLTYLCKYIRLFQKTLDGFSSKCKQNATMLSLLSLKWDVQQLMGVLFLFSLPHQISNTL